MLRKKRLIQSISRNQLKPLAIVLTHCHHDHIAAAEALSKQFNCPIHAHKKEIEGLQNPDLNYSNAPGLMPISILCQHPLTDGDKLTFGKFSLVVYHTPGHTPGGICLKSEQLPIVFTGDTVFSDDIGRTDLNGGDVKAMRRTLTNKVSLWPDETMLYPGHGDQALLKNVRKFLTL